MGFRRGPVRRSATVYLLGGPSALSANVEAEVRGAGFVPKRLQGANQVIVFGGPVAVPPAAVTALTDATGRSGWASYLNRVTPELP